MSFAHHLQCESPPSLPIPPSDPPPPIYNGVQSFEKS